MSKYEYSPLPMLEQQDVLAGLRQELHAHPELTFKKIVPPVWLREGRETEPIGARGGGWPTPAYRAIACAAVARRPA